MCIEGVICMEYYLGFKVFCIYNMYIILDLYCLEKEGSIF